MEMFDKFFGGREDSEQRVQRLIKTLELEAEMDVNEDDKLIHTARQLRDHFAEHNGKVPRGHKVRAVKAIDKLKVKAIHEGGLGKYVLITNLDNISDDIKELI